MLNECLRTVSVTFTHYRARKGMVQNTVTKTHKALRAPVSVPRAPANFFVYDSYIAVLLVWEQNS